MTAPPAITGPDTPLTLQHASWNAYWGHTYWDAHWGFVLAGYGLTLLTLAWLLASTLHRLHRARKRLSLLESLSRNTTPTPPNPPRGQERD